MLERWKAELLQYRVLYKLFSFRVIDLDAISTKGDTIELLGKFAAILIMLSILWGLPPLFSGLQGSTALQRFDDGLGWEHLLISATMLVVGLFTVLGWDSTFPDRRDAMVLLPLPIRSRTLFLAKVTASCTVVGLSALLLNSLTGLTWPLILASHGILGWMRTAAAYWTTMLSAGLFVYCSVLALQGITAQTLPRRYFLRLSAILQVLMFCLFLTTFFLQPEIATLHALGDPANQHALKLLPQYWFLGIFNWLNGTATSQLAQLAQRAGIGLVITIFSTVLALLLSYLRTLRSTIEEPDVVSKRAGLHWSPRLTSNIATAILHFTLRSLVRSRQHRIVMAFYLGVGFAVALACLKSPAALSTLASAPTSPMSLRYLIPTIVMLLFALVAMRVAFAVPVSLNANWIFRMTQVNSPQEYFRANRSVLFLAAVMPTCLATALISLPIYSWELVLIHCAALSILGLILVDLSLLRFHKIPFTCSWLPGRSNVQFVFWAYLFLLMPALDHLARWEQNALGSGSGRYWMIALLAGLWIGTHFLVTRSDGRSVIHFEEEAEATILQLHLYHD